MTTQGTLKCWGNNSTCQLGDGTTKDRTTPVAVVGLTSGVTTVSTGSGHTCAVSRADGVKCWGSNSNGQLGDGTTKDRTNPMDLVGLARGVATVSAPAPYQRPPDPGGPASWPGPHTKWSRQPGTLEAPVF